MKEKYTPGPWHAYDRGIGFEVHRPGNDSNLCDGVPCGGEVNSGFRETFREADAHLIAAAPELYAALQNAAHYIRNCGLDLEHYYPDVVAALAKAEGRSA